MTTTRRTRPSTVPVRVAVDRSGVTPDRFARLFRLLELIADKPLGRDALARKLGLDVRGFYRDLGLLREAGIGVSLTKGHYRLDGDVDEAAARLPFPDPLLTLGEARALAKGKTIAHRKLRDQLTRSGV
jgi:predicted DNA-binding transcriptional regulator YafY